jgi:hypothetical protein
MSDSWVRAYRPDSPCDPVTCCEPVRLACFCVLAGGLACSLVGFLDLMVWSTRSLSDVSFSLLAFPFRVRPAAGFKQGEPIRSASAKGKIRLPSMSLFASESFYEKPNC